MDYYKIQWIMDYTDDDNEYLWVLSESLPEFHIESDAIAAIKVLWHILIGNFPHCAFRILKYENGEFAFVCNVLSLYSAIDRY